MAAATSSLLLISPSDECLASLQEALLACAGQTGSRRLTLTTRYYTAAIELVALPAAAYLAPAAPGAALAAALPPGAPPAEALVLVLDGAQPLDGAALAAASAWAARCAEAALATLLVVSVGCAHLGSGGGSGGAPPSAATAAHLAAAQAWALDHGFEHVEALCSQPALGAAGREKFSVPRVLEALEATLWGCAVMHAPSAARAGAQLAAAGGGSGDAAAILDSAARLGGEGGGGGAEGGGEEGGAGEEEGEAEAADAEQRGYRAPELYGSAGSGGGGAGGVTLEGEEVEALRAAMQALLPAGAGDEGGGGGGGSSGSAARPAQGAASAAAAAAASQFEGLLGQALSIRNAAKDGSMSDAARREAASAMMEKLMAALGLEGEEEEGEEEKAGLGAAVDGAAAAPGK